MVKVLRSTSCVLTESTMPPVMPDVILETVLIVHVSKEKRECVHLAPVSSSVFSLASKLCEVAPILFKAIITGPVSSL